MSGTAVSRSTPAGAGNAGAAPGFPWARLAFGYLLLGLALIAFLPPWEGYDENAHYASIQEAADTGRLPVLGESRLSTNVEQYADYAPLPYASTPPMESNGGYTYRSFFAAGDDVRRRGRSLVHGRPAQPRRYEAGRVFNWQAQHPPLYYWLIAPLYRLTRAWAWAPQLALLRAFSYGMAWAAWCLAAATARRARRRDATASRGAWALTALGLWPALFPAWFADTARLGNDSLCCLVIAAVWAVCLESTREGLSFPRAAALGLLLGLGCLTKVFLVPVTAGVLAFWAARLLARGKWRTGLAKLALAAAVALAVSGWWYVRCWRLYGSPIVSATDVLMPAPPGGVMHGFAAHVPLPLFARNLAALVASAAWTPTWSLARPSGWWLVPLVASMGLAALFYVRAARRAPATSEDRLPLWMAVPLIAGLTLALAMKGAFGAPGGIGGYYLQVLLAPLSWAFGLALSASWPGGLVHQAWKALVVYAVAFGIATQWAQAMLYAGIVFKAGASKDYQLEGLPRWLGIPEGLERLRSLTYPDAGAVLWVVALAMIVSGLLALGRHADRNAGRKQAR